MKYPFSANLFKFCRRVLDLKYGGVRVIDQDVGQILGFDPADCSHWKKGKKNIRSIQAISSIADFLQVDRKLIIDLATGEINEIDAYFEYTGYGSFALEAAVIEGAKKAYYRKHAGRWTKEKEQEFRTYFSIETGAIDRAVAKVHGAINLREPPLFLPEISGSFPHVLLKPEERLPQIDLYPPLHSYVQGNQFVVSYQLGEDDHPAMRFRIAKAMAGYFLPIQQAPVAELKTYQGQILSVQGNLFAARLLVPLSLLQKAIATMQVSKDLSEQLAELFWVSKGLVNRRLQELMLLLALT